MRQFDLNIKYVCACLFVYACCVCVCVHGFVFCEITSLPLRDLIIINLVSSLMVYVFKYPVLFV